jgi:alpha,alpha-trehalase
LPEIFELYPLFADVQSKKIFADSKTFVDCVPLFAVDKILSDYVQQKEEPGFDLKLFVADHFDLPTALPDAPLSIDAGKPVTEHIESLWPVLTRQPQPKNGSLLPLPYPYVVPGGRFREIFYWDSYFTMLGLRVSGKTELIRYMVDNFSHLIDSIGYIPNGSRTYFIGRSQPPFYSLMVQLLAEEAGNAILIDYLPQLRKEYDFWMKGKDELDESNPALYHSVRPGNGVVLNRYWDENNSPRPEAYSEDIKLGRRSTDNNVYGHLRAAAESGWDFSSRWFKCPEDFATIQTEDIIPVDLNCILFHLEETLAAAYAWSGDSIAAEQFSSYAAKRKATINRYCWNEELGFYFDYNFKDQQQKQNITLAAAFPLFFNIATGDQAKKVVEILTRDLLKDGGFVTTTITSGQQWDAPNGWAPLQWIAINGLENYGYNREARKAAHHWIKLNNDVYNRTGKLMEKYNVEDINLTAGGGEYPNQDGFGWTNGVLLALIKKYGAPE